MRSRLVSAGLLFLAAPAAWAEAPSPGAQQWVQKASVVQYTLKHPMHEVGGKSTVAEVIGVVDPTGLKVMARAPVKSFESGNANRDAHMLEVVEGAKYPLVVIRGVAPGFVLPAVGSEAKAELAAEVELHGVRVKQPISLVVQTKEAGLVKVTFQFVASLTAHKIERPSLMLFPVEDGLQITGSFELQPKP